jgi:hypothetical protein
MCCIFVSCMVGSVSLDGESNCALIFPGATNHPPTAREVIIEALTHVSVDELQAAIQTLQEERQSRFLPMLDNSVCFLYQPMVLIPV